MIQLSQPGGVGDLDKNGPIKTGILCYLISQETESWSWQLKAPEGSNARLSAPLSPYPNFAPDIPGTYKITFTDHTGKEYNLTAKAA